MVGDVGPGKLFEYFASVRLQAGVEPEPERRTRRHRQNVREKIARRIHYVDASIEICYPNVDVQAEDQQTSRNHLQFIDQQLVSVAVVDLLFRPFRERMR